MFNHETTHAPVQLTARKAEGCCVIEPFDMGLGGHTRQSPDEK